jgi:hypothetical protein
MKSQIEFVGNAGLVLTLCDQSIYEMLAKAINTELPSIKDDDFLRVEYEYSHNRISIFEMDVKTQGIIQRLDSFVLADYGFRYKFNIITYADDWTTLINFDTKTKNFIMNIFQKIEKIKGFLSQSYKIRLSIVNGMLYIELVRKTTYDIEKVYKIKL